MARHGENIYRRKDGRYEGRYVIGKTLSGKTRFGYIYGHQYAEVKKALLIRKAEFAKKSLSDAHLYKGSLSEWMLEWMENDVLGSVKISSYQAYLNLLNRHILPQLGKLRLVNISPGVVQEFIHVLENSGLSANTIKGAYRLLSAAMKAALEEGFIAKNPCRKIKIQHGIVKEQRILTDDERRKIAGQTDLPTLLSLYTGLRLGEICALKWSDIDWKRCTISVKRTAQRVQRGKKTVLIVGTPKFLRSQRTIPLPAYILEALRNSAQNVRSDTYIFGTSQTPAEPRTIQRRFHKLMGKLGIADVHFHTLRHSFATQLLELGVDIKTVSVLLGHGSAKTTLDFYAHSQIEWQRKAVNLLMTG